ncbi:hypothetical protein [Streptomyces albus]|uniref:hypothetical protein n=1 Tax=Streptomyces albus TaxID=1888 RepID=UPI0033DFC905
MSDVPMWPLTPVQADGMACVVCATEFVNTDVASVPVGYSETGSQVFACKGPCEQAVNDATALNQTASPTAPDEGQSSREVIMVGGDSEFWRLLRDLRALGGAEALLTVTDDVASIRDLLHLTVRHASAAADRARWVLRNTTPRGGDG